MVQRTGIVELGGVVRKDLQPGLLATILMIALHLNFHVLKSSYEIERG